MKKQVKIASVVLMVVLLATMAAAAVQKPAPQQTQTASQLVIGAQDVITASDAGGGALSSRDMIWIILIGVGVVILILVL
jgi:uncharacterized lipoprotein YbaY